MVDVAEIVLELEASNFTNSGKATRGRVMRNLDSGSLVCEVDDNIKGIPAPRGEFSTIEEARAALVEYWDRCDVALESSAHWTHRT